VKPHPVVSTRKSDYYAQLQNAFGPPATWLSRSRVTRRFGGEWPLVGDKGVKIAGGPLNIGRHIRRDDAPIRVVVATNRDIRGNF
jgi:hypothetical protein